MCDIRYHPIVVGYNEIQNTCSIVTSLSVRFYYYYYYTAGNAPYVIRNEAMNRRHGFSIN